MAKNKGISEKSLLKRNAKKPFGPWEEKIIPVNHELRPRLKSLKESWRRENYLNNRYSVQISDYATDWGLVTHLWIRRHDGDMPRSWSDLQRIKNEIVGKGRTALEVFPEEENLVDEANLAHLWVMPVDFVLPFTL